MQDLYVISYKYDGDSTLRKLERNADSSGFVGENYSVILPENIKPLDKVYIFSNLAQIVKIEKYINLRIVGFVEGKQILPGQIVEFSRFGKTSITGEKLSENIMPGDSVLLDSYWYDVEAIS